MGAKRVFRSNLTKGPACAENLESPGVSARGAAEWVVEELSRVHGFAGAFLQGSIVWRPGDAAIPANSDVDVTEAIIAANPRVKD